MAPIIILILFIAGLIAGTAVFTYESIKEQEPRAPKIGIAALVIRMVRLIFILFLPVSRIPITIIVVASILLGLLFVFPEHLGRPLSKDPWVML